MIVFVIGVLTLDCDWWRGLGGKLRSAPNLSDVIAVGLKFNPWSRRYYTWVTKCTVVNVIFVQWLDSLLVEDRDLFSFAAKSEERMQKKNILTPL